MKRRLLSLCGLGSISLLVIGTSILSVHAYDAYRPKNPARGAWSFSQTVLFFSGAPTPITEVGTLNMDGCGKFTGLGIINPPDPAFAGFELPFEGECVLRENGVNVMDCTIVNAPGLSDIRRVCVLMEKTGECFQEFRCVRPDGVNEPGTVLLVEFKRQQSGSCK
jgi:hypothetical protein